MCYPHYKVHISDTCQKDTPLLGPTTLFILVTDSQCTYTAYHQLNVNAIFKFINNQEVILRIYMFHLMSPLDFGNISNVLLSGERYIHGFL